MKTVISLAIVLLLSSKSFSQQIITISNDTTISTTLNVSSNTILNLNGHKLTLSGAPKLKITNRATLLIKDGQLVNFSNYGEILEGSLEWRTAFSKGSISCCGSGFNGYSATTWLDGVPK